MRRAFLSITALIIALVVRAGARCPTFAGTLNELEHDVSGRLSVSSDCVVTIDNFNYDGLAPSTYIYWAEECSTRSLSRGGRFSNKEVPQRRVNGGTFTADVKPGLDFEQIGCLSVYCEQFSADLGDVETKFDVKAVVPASPTASPTASPPPVPVPVPSPDAPSGQCPTFSGDLSQIEHDVSGRISVDADCQVRIDDFTYDGQAPQVYLWWGEDCSPQSISRGGRFSDEEVPERAVDGGTFTGAVRSGLDFERIGCLSVYCEAFNANFGDAETEFDCNTADCENYAAPPPSSPSSPSSPPPDSTSPSPAPGGLYGLENCQVLKQGYLQSHWTLEADKGTVKMALEGRPGPGDAWMSFGYSPPGSAGAQMVGSRVVVAGYAGDDCFAYDYLLSNREQCDFLNGEGVCPLAYSGNTGLADIPIPPLQLECARNGTYISVLFERPLDTWPTDGSDPAVWAMGPVSPESDASRPVVLYHTLALPGSGSGTPTPVNTPTGENLVVSLDQAQNSCSDLSSLSDDESGSQGAVVVPVIYNTTEFTVTSGPYTVHPDPPGWGLSYIMNDVPLAVVNMVRGQTYTFTVMAGPTHPLYFTTSSFGAGELTDFENEVVYAGGEESFGTDVEPFVLTVTPNSTWPDTLYYQCAVHQKLGWQVKVYDSQEESDKAGRAVDAEMSSLPDAGAISQEVLSTFVVGGNCEMGVDGFQSTFQSCAQVADGNGGNGFIYAWNISAGSDPSSTMLTMGINATLPSNGYVSIAFPETRDTMIGADAFVLSRDDSDVVRLLPYVLGGQTQAAVQSVENDVGRLQQVELIEIAPSSLDGDVAVGSFTVQIPVPLATRRRRLSNSPTASLDDFNFIWSSGRVNGDGNPTYHGPDKGGIDANLVSGTSSANMNTQTINWTARKAHMWLMAIGWGLLIPSGIVAVRAKRTVLSNCDKPYSWFNMHRAAMTLGYLCGIGGIAAGFAVRGTWSTPYTVHRDLGVTITVLGFVQVLSLVARPAISSKTRWIWLSWHRVIGVSTVCLAIANVYYGMFYVAEVSSWAWGLYTGLLAAIVALGVANEAWAVQESRRMRAEAKEFRSV